MTSTSKHTPVRHRFVARRLFAECIGTFLLVTVDCGGAVIDALDGESTAPARLAATGLLVMTMVYSIGNV